MLFKLRRWIRLANELFMGILFIIAIMIFFELWLNLYDIRQTYNRANDIERAKMLSSTKGK